MPIRFRCLLGDALFPWGIPCTYAQRRCAGFACALVLYSVGAV
ncbi:hypothetical protein TPCCA_0262a [Treponema paraluiscuniculi Cuniculi A]|uniref:Uncharacterized protein n=2 Tax=Treponema paraluiscuniculi TaxID=53435 RepID=F7XS89_TREPU|nr:hypothetical protein TPCCA_0262a [Treponema paraluiscuniculi Cuniculi A]WKC72148.1 hypothetical protein TPLL2_0262a [Treponema paraluiscuniculi]